ncbi:MAG: hypothetical protein AAF787_24580 [Chloroflexota bacterium]
MTVAIAQDHHTYSITSNMIETFNRATGEPENITTANSLIAVPYVQATIHEALRAEPHTFLAQSLKFRRDVFDGDTLRPSTTVVSRSGNQIVLATTVYNQENTVVLDCETVVELR